MTETQSTPATLTGHDRRDDAAAVIDQIVRFFRVMKRSGARFAAQHKDGLEQAAFYLLGVLVTEGPRRTTTLAEAVHSDASTVSRQVGALVRHGLVERQADPGDRRACLLAATPEGLRLFQAQRDARQRHLANVLDGWTAEDLRNARALLDRLNTDFERCDVAMAASAVAPVAYQRGGAQ